MYAADTETFALRRNRFRTLTVESLVNDLRIGARRMDPLERQFYGVGKDLIVCFGH